MTIDLLADVRADFDRLAAPLERALAYSGGTHDLDDIWQGVAEGRFQHWAGVDSVMVTELHVTPKVKSVHIFLAGGNLAELRAMVDPVLEWAKEQGCTRATFAGRRGWERSWATQGWTAPLVVMEKAL